MGLAVDPVDERQAPEGRQDDETDGGPSSWGAADGGWTPSTTTDPWAVESADAAGASLVTSAEVSEADPDSSFFEEGATGEDELGDDPLAAMVSEAVERVTDGDGAN